MKRILSLLIALLIAASAHAGPIVFDNVLPSVMSNTDPLLAHLQNRYGSYALYMAFPSTRDRVTNIPITSSAAGAWVYNGVEFPAGTPVISAGKMVGSGVVENKFNTPLVPATQSVTLAAGAWTMFCAGTGSVSFDGNTATDGTPVTFVLASETTANATVTGDLNYVQINSGAYPKTLNTTGSPFVTLAGTNTLQNISTAHPALYTALNGPNAVGSLFCQWEPQFDADETGLGADLVTNGGFDTDADWTKGVGWTIADGLLNINTGSSTFSQQSIGAQINTTYQVTYTVSNYASGGVRCYVGSSTYTIRSADGTYTENLKNTSTNSQLYIQAYGSFVGSVDNVIVKQVIATGIFSCGDFDLLYSAAQERLELSDGTNTASVALTCVAGTPYFVWAQWDGPNSQMRIGYSLTETGTITWGDYATFAGTFTPDPTFTFLPGPDYQLLGPKVLIYKAVTP